MAYSDRVGITTAELRWRSIVLLCDAVFSH